MKRLSFAAEVLTDPPLMFCDEPTSGLDSFMAQNVVEVMRQASDKKYYICIPLHHIRYSNHKLIFLISNIQHAL